MSLDVVAALPIVIPEKRRRGKHKSVPAFTGMTNGAKARSHQYQET